MIKPLVARERLAELEHEQWAHWTAYMLDNLTPENIERWRRQVATSYADLSESEKESDRVWVDRLLAELRELDPAMVDAGDYALAEYDKQDSPDAEGKYGFAGDFKAGWCAAIDAISGGEG